MLGEPKEKCECEGQPESEQKYQASGPIVRIVQPWAHANFFFDPWVIAGAVVGAIVGKIAEELIRIYSGPEVVRIHGDSVTQIARLLAAQIEESEREYFEAEVRTAQDKLAIYRTNPELHRSLLDDVALSMVSVSNHFERIGASAIGGWVASVNLALSAYVIKSAIDERYIESAKEIARRRIPNGKDLIAAGLQHSIKRVSNECTCEEKYDGVHGWRWHCKHTVDGNERKNAARKRDDAASRCRSDRLGARDQIVNDAKTNVLNPAEDCLNHWQEFVNS